MAKRVGEWVPTRLLDRQQARQDALQAGFDLAMRQLHGVIGCDEWCREALHPLRSPALVAEETAQGVPMPQGPR